MYQVKIKVTKPGYKPAIFKGVFMPQGRTCKKEIIEKQCHDLLKKGLKESHDLDVELQTIEIKKLKNDFVCCESKKQS